MGGREIFWEEEKANLSALRRDLHADAEDQDADVWHCPVEVGLCAPAVPEDACRHEHGAGNEEREAEFWAAGR